jgi:hypothetical protein
MTRTIDVSKSKDVCLSLVYNLGKNFHRKFKMPVFQIVSREGRRERMRVRKINRYGGSGD